MWPYQEYHGAGAWSTECIIKIVTFIVTINSGTQNHCTNFKHTFDRGVSTSQSSHDAPQDLERPHKTSQAAWAATPLERIPVTALTARQDVLHRWLPQDVCNGCHRDDAVQSCWVDVWQKLSLVPKCVFVSSAGFHGLLNDRLN